MLLAQAQATVLAVPYLLLPAQPLMRRPQVVPSIFLAAKALLLAVIFVLWVVAAKILVVHSR